jgi:hypothetical protein
MKSFSSVKGDPGAPTGLTRWQRQYSEEKEWHKGLQFDQDSGKQNLSACN